jgi:hypothetical protein
MNSNELTSLKNLGVYVQSTLEGAIREFWGFRATLFEDKLLQK